MCVAFRVWFSTIEERTHRAHTGCCRAAHVPRGDSTFTPPTLPGRRGYRSTSVRTTAYATKYPAHSWTGVGPWNTPRSYPDSVSVPKTPSQCLKEPESHPTEGLDPIFSTGWQVDRNLTAIGCLSLSLPVPLRELEPDKSADLSLPVPHCPSLSVEENDYEQRRSQVRVLPSAPLIPLQMEGFLAKWFRP